MSSQAPITGSGGVAIEPQTQASAANGAVTLPEASERPSAEGSGTFATPTQRVVRRAIAVAEPIGDAKATATGRRRPSWFSRLLRRIGHAPPGWLTSAVVHGAALMLLALSASLARLLPDPPAILVTTLSGEPPDSIRAADAV